MALALANSPVAEAYETAGKIATLAGSLVSAVVGAVILSGTLKPR